MKKPNGTTLSSLQKKQLQDKLIILKDEEEKAKKMIENIKLEMETEKTTRENIKEVFENIENPLPEIQARIKEHFPISKIRLWKWKTKEETEKNIRKEIFSDSKFKEFFAKYSNKIEKGFIIMMLVWSILTLIYGVNQYISTKKLNDKIKKMQETEQIDQDSTHNQWETILPPDPNKITLEELQNTIGENRRDGITYQQVYDALTNRDSSDAKIKLINFFKKWDIMAAQNYLGMLANSEYESNDASGYVDQNTLDRLSDPMFWLSGEKIENNPDIPDDVYESYKTFQSWQINFNGADYFIISKTDCKMYIFNTSHQLIHVQKVWLGSKIWDSKFNFQNNHTTPTGYYRIEGNKRTTDAYGTVKYIPTTMKNGKITVEGGNGYLLDLLPIDIKTGKFNGAYNPNQWALAIHATPKKLLEERTKLFEDPNASKRFTGGCVDASFYSIAHDNAKAGTNGSIVFVTADPK